MTVGLAAAVGGALVGAWLGFHATDRLLALITAIVGAAAGANLAVLALDIAWDRSARDRVAEPTRPAGVRDRRGVGGAPSRGTRSHPGPRPRRAPPALIAAEDAAH